MFFPTGQAALIRSFPDRADLQKELASPELFPHRAGGADQVVPGQARSAEEAGRGPRFFPTGHAALIRSFPDTADLQNKLASPELFPHRASGADQVVPGHGRSAEEAGRRLIFSPTARAAARPPITRFAGNNRGAA
jgi:hypothetical protein